MTIPTTRRRFLGLATLAVGSTALAACGTSGPATGGSAGPGGSAPAGSATMWSLSGQPNEAIDKASVDAFNQAHPNGKIALTFFQNDAYKQKIFTALGAGQAPTLIYGWGGGGLRSYVKAGQVMDLTDFVDKTAAVKDRYVDAVWEAGKVDGKIYALAGNATQPIILYYNKELFTKHNLAAPATWDDLMKCVTTLNAAGVAPIALAGQSKWTSMMWLEYLLDRIGGPDPFRNIAAGKPKAWSDPAVIETCTRVQDLVKANAFIKGFASIAADSNADQALLYTGKAAMLLQGGWIYGGLKADGGGFVQGGKLGWTPFPTMPGGKGDAKAAVGNPANYWAISAKATEVQATIAKQWLTEGLLNTTQVDSYIKNGSVPVVRGIEDKLKGTDDKDFLTYVYSLINDAPNFTQSWDQALSPTVATALLDNISKLFLMSITPQQFADAMNATIGQ